MLHNWSFSFSGKILFSSFLSDSNSIFFPYLFDCSFLVSHISPFFSGILLIAQVFKVKFSRKTFFFFFGTFPKIITSNPFALIINYTLMIFVCFFAAQTLTSIFQPKYPTVYRTSSHECLKDISNLTKPKENYRFLFPFPSLCHNYHPKSFPISINSTNIPTVSQAQNIGMTTKSFTVGQTLNSDHQQNPKVFPTNISQIKMLLAISSTTTVVQIIVIFPYLNIVKKSVTKWEIKSWYSV